MGQAIEGYKEVEELTATVVAVKGDSELGQEH